MRSATPRRARRPRPAAGSGSLMAGRAVTAPASSGGGPPPSTGRGGEGLAKEVEAPFGEGRYPRSPALLLEHRFEVVGDRGGDHPLAHQAHRLAARHGEVGHLLAVRTRLLAAVGDHRLRAPLQPLGRHPHQLVVADPLLVLEGGHVQVREALAHLLDHLGGGHQLEPGEGAAAGDLARPHLLRAGSRPPPPRRCRSGSPCSPARRGRRRGTRRRCGPVARGGGRAAERRRRRGSGRRRRRAGGGSRRCARRACRGSGW